MRKQMQAGPVLFRHIQSHPMVLEAVGNLAIMLNQMLETLTPEERLEMFFRACDGYCEYCGFETPEGARCMCMRDE